MLTVKIGLIPPSTFLGFSLHEPGYRVILGMKHLVFYCKLFVVYYWLEHAVMHHNTHYQSFEKDTCLCRKFLGRCNFKLSPGSALQFNQMRRMSLGGKIKDTHGAITWLGWINEQRNIIRWNDSYIRASGLVIINCKLIAVNQWALTQFLLWTLL